MIQSPIAVAIGIIIRRKHVLLALRHQQLDQGGLWEFPGGKLEHDETAYQALCRELIEEIGITVITAEPLPSQIYQYPKYQVCLYPWIVSEFMGEPFGCEGQDTRWVALADLSEIAMPEANRNIIERVLAIS